MPNCKHVFYIKENKCWYCDMSMLPVEQDCKAICFTHPDSKVDTAHNLRDYLEDSFLDTMEDNW